MAVIYKPKGRALEYSYLAVNHYNGCGHGCKYCYARAMAQRAGRHFSENQSPRKNIIDLLRKQAPSYTGTDKRVLLSFSCDPYQPLDDREKLTRQIIEILRENEIPFQILTKGGTRAVRDFDLYSKYDAFATTMTFLDESQSLQWEPNAALPESRIEAIKIAHERGIETWVSLEPVIDAEPSLKIIERTCEFTDLYKIGILNHYRSDIDWRKFGIDALQLCQKYKNLITLKKICPNI